VILERLDFVYCPSRDVAAEIDAFVASLGARLVFAIEAFGTRVAMLELTPEPPAILLAGHLEGERPVLVHRVADLEGAIATLAERGCEPASRFEIPHGPCCELVLPGGHRVAMYELTRPDTAQRLAGRRDF
jgi:hypothetical protein